MLHRESLRRSIHNQLVHQLNLCSKPSDPGVTLELRNVDLLSLWSAVQQYCGPYKDHLCTLDISYSRLNKDTIFEISNVLATSLRNFRLAACHLTHLHPGMVWPKRLEELDLARNELTQFPPGVGVLKNLKTLNLSGNRISEFDADVLTLPRLSRLLLVRNPIVNIPANVRLGSVAGMRRYFKVTCSQELEESAPPELQDVCYDHHVRLSESESGYESEGAISRRNTLSVESTTCVCVSLCGGIPSGYAPIANHKNCTICLSTTSPASITCTIDIIEDVSLYPPVQPREVLVTPVIKAGPHGLHFPADSPAILILPHCFPLGSSHDYRLVPMCSNTGPHQPTRWEPLPLQGLICHLFQDHHVIFPTTHFSMFAVILVCPYPTSEAVIIPEEGGTLQTPDLPGFVVRFPPHALLSTTTVKATVYYADGPYHLQDDETGTLASACVGLEPHGTVFYHPVKVSLPVLGSPNAISQSGARLQVWWAPFNPERVAVLEWSELSCVEVTVTLIPGGLVASFDLKHFSFFKLVWNYCRDTVVRITEGAMFAYRGLRNCIISMICQVFLSTPQSDQTCAIILVAYKFGNPLPPLSNYPLKVGESGAVQLTVGRIEVALSGELSSHLCENSLVRTLVFSGEDFSVQFLLQLTNELQSHRPFGTMLLSCSATTGVSPHQINLVAVSG